MADFLVAVLGALLSSIFFLRAVTWCLRVLGLR